MRRTFASLTAPWVPPAMLDTKMTVPPPPCGEAGGLQGVSVQYSARIATTAHWRRMAVSTYEERMDENSTYYPFIGPNSDEFSVKYLPRPYKDPIKNRPMLEIGEPLHKLPRRVPVIFLVNLFNKRLNTYYGKRLETVYVKSEFAREELIPQRYATYATPEAYALLGLPPMDHKINMVLPKTQKDMEKAIERRMWDEERWRFTVDYLFRSYDSGPTELADVVEEWDGNEELGASGGTAAAGTAAKGGPIRARKARKIKLF